MIKRKAVVDLFEFIDRTQKLATIFTGDDGLDMIKRQIIERTINSGMSVGEALAHLMDTMA